MPWQCLWKALCSPYSCSCSYSWCSVFSFFWPILLSHWSAANVLAFLLLHSGTAKLSCMFCWYKLKMCAYFHIIGARRLNSKHLFSTNTPSPQVWRPLWQTIATEVKGSTALWVYLLLFCLPWFSVVISAKPDLSMDQRCVQYIVCFLKSFVFAK